MGWGKGKLRVTTSFLSTVFVALAGVSATLGPVAAQPVTPLEKSMEAVPGPALGQKYDGVVPGPVGKNPLPAAPKGGPYLVWTGFQMTATGSRVFLQTTQPVQFDLNEGAAKKSSHSTLAVLLRGCRIHMANNRRSLDTRAFATPVQSVLAKQSRKDVELLITLREPASSTPATEPGPNGTRFLVFDFPPGKAAVIEEKAPAGSDSAPRGATSGEGWSLSGDGNSVKAEAKGRAKSKGKTRAAAAPDQAAPAASPPVETTPTATPSAGAK